MPNFEKQIIGGTQRTAVTAGGRENGLEANEMQRANSEAGE